MLRRMEKSLSVLICREGFFLIACWRVKQLCLCTDCVCYMGFHMQSVKHEHMMQRLMGKAPFLSQFSSRVSYKPQ